MFLGMVDSGYLTGTTTEPQPRRDHASDRLLAAISWALAPRTMVVPRLC